MLPTSAPFPVVRDGSPAGPGGGGKMCSGAWKCGPQRPVAVISLLEAYWFSYLRAKFCIFSIAIIIYVYIFLHVNSDLGQEYHSTFRSVTDLKFLVFTGSFSVIISQFSCTMGPEILQIMNCKYDITHVKLSTTQMGWLWNKNTLFILYQLQWLWRKHVSNCSCRWAPLVRCLAICRHTDGQILSHTCLGL